MDNEIPPLEEATCHSSFLDNCQADFECLESVGDEKVQIFSLTPGYSPIRFALDHPILSPT